MLNFDRSAIKHGTVLRIFKMITTFLAALIKVHQIRCRPVLRPGPLWGSLQLSPDPLAGLRGTNSQWIGGKAEKKRRKETGGTAS